MLGITAIVPTHKRPEMLERALRSIAAQVRRPRRVIVVDDDPDAPDLPAAAPLREAAVPVSVLRNTGPRGASGARNTGAREADTGFLAFLDDDDEWHPAFLSEALALIRLHDLDLVCSDFVHVDDAGRESPGKRAPDVIEPDAFLTRNPGMRGSNFVIRRSLFFDIGGFDETLPTLNDRDFGLRLALRSGLRYRPLRRRLVRYHKHALPRLTEPPSAVNGLGVRRFFRLHGHLMSPLQRKRFEENASRLWGVNRSELARGEAACSSP